MKISVDDSKGYPLDFVITLEDNNEALFIHDLFLLTNGMLKDESCYEPLTKDIYLMLRKVWQKNYKVDFDKINDVLQKEYGFSLPSSLKKQQGGE